MIKITMMKTMRWLPLILVSVLDLVGVVPWGVLIEILVCG